MLKSTRNNLKKIEGLFEEIGYVVRYEKGNFQSGYCMVENRQIAIINKFFDVEGRINCLIEILSNIEVEESNLSEQATKVYKQIQKEINQKLASAEKTSTPSDSE